MSPQRRGQVVILVGIALLGFNLRSGVSSFSPIVEAISADIPIDPIIVGVVGAITPLAFGLGGTIGPATVRWLGLDRATRMAIAVMVIGHVVRGIAPNVAALIVGTSLALLAAGVGNVLLTGLIKRYFPTRIGSITMVALACFAIGASSPPVVAVPIADALGWRVSLATWAAVAAIAIVPWIIHALAPRPHHDTHHVDEPEAKLTLRLIRSPMAWTMTAMFGVNSVMSYTVFAWFPTMLVEHGGFTSAEAAPLISIFAIGGLVLSLIPPVVARRPWLTAPLIVFGLLCLATALTGLWLVPALAPLWLAIYSVGGTMFPVTIVLINLRTRSHATAVALSGFVQGIGFVLAALVPIVIGIIHQAGGNWPVILIGLLAMLVLIVPGVFVFRRPGYLEDELAHRPRSA